MLSYCVMLSCHSALIEILQKIHCSASCFEYFESYQKRWAPLKGLCKFSAYVLAMPQLSETMVVSRQTACGARGSSATPFGQGLSSSTVCTKSFWSFHDLSAVVFMFFFDVFLKRFQESNFQVSQFPRQKCRRTLVNGARS